MAFDKSKPLHIQVDNGTSVKYKMLTSDNNWSMSSLGLWYVEDKRHKFAPWTSVIEIFQFINTEYSDGKSH